MQLSIGHMDVYSSFSGAPELRWNTTNHCGPATRRWAVPHILTEELYIACGSQCHMGLLNVLCGSCHNATQQICQRLSGTPGLQSYDIEYYSISTNLEAGVLLYDTTTQLRFAWLSCQMGVATLDGLICYHQTDDRSKIPRCTWKWLNYAFSPFWLRNAYMASGFQVHHKFRSEK